MLIILVKIGYFNVETCINDYLWNSSSSLFYRLYGSIFEVCSHTHKKIKYGEFLDKQLRTFPIQIKDRALVLIKQPYFLFLSQGKNWFTVY